MALDQAMKNAWAEWTRSRDTRYFIALKYFCYTKNSCLNRNRNLLCPVALYVVVGSWVSSWIQEQPRGASFYIQVSIGNWNWNKIHVSNGLRIEWPGPQQCIATITTIIIELYALNDSAITNFIYNLRCVDELWLQRIIINSMQDSGGWDGPDLCVESGPQVRSWRFVNWKDIQFAVRRDVTEGTVLLAIFRPVGMCRRGLQLVLPV